MTEEPDYNAANEEIFQMDLDAREEAARAANYIAVERKFQTGELRPLVPQPKEVIEMPKIDERPAILTSGGEEPKPLAAAQCTCYKGGCELHTGVKAWSPPPAAAQRPYSEVCLDPSATPCERETALLEEFNSALRELSEARENAVELNYACEQQGARLAAQAEQIERQRALLAKIHHPLFSMTRGELCAAINAVLSHPAPSVRDNT